MSQNNIGPIDPYVFDGGDLAEKLPASEGAIHSSHHGAARPPYAVRGMIWVKSVSPTLAEIYYFDGNHDVLLFSVNPETGVGILPAARLSGTYPITVTNADKVDGLHASQFLRSDRAATTNSDLTVRGNLFVGPNVRGDSRIKFYDSNAETLRDLFWSYTDHDWRIEAGDGTNGKLWHQGNDGAESGLDADLLDGLQAAQFLRKDRNGQLAGSLTTTGDVTAPNFASTSDARLKSDIEQIGSALALIQSLRGVRYTMEGATEGARQVGVIAQEIQPHIPEVVSAGEDGYLRVAYGPLVAPLIEAVKELAARVEVLEGARHDAE